MSETKWQDVRKIHRDYKGFYELAGGLSLFAVLGLFGLVIFAADQFGYQMNVYTELISVALTILVLDRRAAKRAEKEHKEELIFQFGSEDNSAALSACRMLKFKGWLDDGSLYGADLKGANLKGAQLFDVNMAGVDLSNANLKGANLSGADLRETRLVRGHVEDITLDEQTMLPDGSRWTPDTDIERYTNPEHPDFWQPEWAVAK